MHKISMVLEISYPMLFTIAEFIPGVLVHLSKSKSIHLVYFKYIPDLFILFVSRFSDSLFLFAQKDREDITEPKLKSCRSEKTRCLIKILEMLFSLLKVVCLERHFIAAHIAIESAANLMLEQPFVFRMINSLSHKDQTPV